MVARDDRGVGKEGRKMLREPPFEKLPVSIVQGAHISLACFERGLPKCVLGLAYGRRRLE
jgi:hypothetical protein